MISCFETIEMLGGRFFALGHHLDRLRAAAAALGLPPVDMETVLDALETTREIHHGHRPGPAGSAPLHHQVRVSWDRSAVPIVVSRPFLRSPDPVVVEIDPSSRHDPVGALGGLKANTYAGAAAVTVAHPHADEVLVVDHHDHVVGCLYANVFVVVPADVGSDPVLVTPPLGDGTRDGVTRSLVLSGLRSIGSPVAERPVSVEEMVDARAVFITSTGHGVRAVCSIGGRPLDTESPFIAQAGRVLDSLRSDPTMWG